MYNQQLEELIDAALEDGVLTEKEKQVLFKKAQSMGIDLDEFEMVLDARLVKLQKEEKAKAQESAPKSSKYGDVRKCPVCGALVPALSGVCTECGYEFTGVDANLSSKELSQKIDLILAEAGRKKEELRKSGKYSNERKKNEWKSPLEKACDDIDDDAETLIETTIENFAVPNTKSDLFEFITFLKTKEKTAVYSDVYHAKLEECLSKAKYIFPNDSIFNSIFEEQENKKKKKGKKQNTTMIIMLLIAFGSASLLFFLLDCNIVWRILIAAFAFGIIGGVGVMMTDDV